MRSMIQKPGDQIEGVSQHRSVAGPLQKGGGQSNDVTHSAFAPAPTIDSEGEEPTERCYPTGSCSSPIEGEVGKDHLSSVTQPASVDPYSLLFLLHHDRQDYLRAEVSMTLRIKARLRWRHEGDCDKANTIYDDARHIGTRYALKGSIEDAARGLADSEAFFEVERLLRVAREVPEKEMKRVAADLPLASWVEQTRGLGMLGFAQIIAEAGDLSNYSGPAKLWKRFGLAPGQRRLKGCGKKHPAGKTCIKCDAAIQMGFSPSRRAVMSVIGDSLMKMGEEYRQVYLVEKERQRSLHPELTKAHTHNRALRYMEKRLLRDLWRENKRIAGIGEAK